MRPLAHLTAVTAAVVLGVAAGTAGAAPQQNIVQTAASTGQFTTLVKLAKQAGLAGALTGKGKLTVFAPTDAAFAKVPKATLAALAKDKAQLRRVLLYHVVKGNVRAAQVVKLRSATTLEGAKVRISVRGGSVYLNGSTKVVKTDVTASNGVIHVVDKVLLPPS